MTTFLIVGGLMFLAVGMVASQLLRLRDWLNRQSAVYLAESEGPATPETTEPQ